jgi:hypothetical protein
LHGDISKVRDLAMSLQRIFRWSFSGNKKAHAQKWAFLFAKYS